MPALLPAVPVLFPSMGGGVYGRWWFWRPHGGGSGVAVEVGFSRSLQQGLKHGMYP